MWMPTFACPDCRMPLKGVVCFQCRRAFEERNGIWRFLMAPEHATLTAFLRQYREVRARDGHRRSSPDFYRQLPSVAAHDPQAHEWQMRRESYRTLLRQVLAAAPPALRVLDLGAGSGWLSHRLAELGHLSVAVDVLDDDVDGLGAARHYPIRFVLVQADFSQLPFAPRQFDLVVFNASLHYAPDAADALAHARAMLVDGGVLAVMDSPMFRGEADGHRMVAAMRDRWRSACGLASVVQPGAGYVTFDALDRAAAALDLQSTFVPSRGSLGWRARRQVARFRLRRAPAAFGVWVAR